MGFKVSWFAFHNISKEDVLQRLTLVDTGIVDEANESPVSGTEIPGSWFILFANDFEFATSQRLSSLSANCRLVAGQVHEGIMYSAACGYEHGTSVWELSHDAQEGVYSLTSSGSLPPCFEQIRENLIGKQDAAGGQSSDVDYVFDIPVEPAYALCGYCHDKWRFDWGERKFIRLVSTLADR
jgi:hypothetical protein